MIPPNKLHWYIQGDDGVPELYLDNHMMQTFRGCEQRGVHEFIEGHGGAGRIWFLDFGSVVHKLVEIYYIKRKQSHFSIENWAIQTARAVWDIYDMDYYIKLKDKDCEVLGGYSGLCGLLLQYAHTYNIDNERFRIIGTELYFGKGKEVFLGEIVSTDNWGNLQIIRVYLSGKIDLLADNGTNIGPIDHKTSKHFMGKDPAGMYYVHEGMEGYVFAARKLLDKVAPESSRRCNTMWMNFMQVKPEDKMSDRFKRIPILYTDEMLEEYRLRMLRTASKIYQLLQAPDPYLAADRGTDKCTNWMYRTCAFHAAHRQKSRAQVYQILNHDMPVREIWNPETRDDKIVINELQEVGGKIEINNPTF